MTNKQELQAVVSQWHKDQAKQDKQAEIVVNIIVVVLSCTVLSAFINWPMF